MTQWKLREAKDRRSEVARKAKDQAPHVIALRGNDAVVAVAADACARLTRKPKGALVDFLRHSPLRGVALDLARSRNTDDLERYGARCVNPWVGR